MSTPECPSDPTLNHAIGANEKIAQAWQHRFSGRHQQAEQLTAELESWLHSAILTTAAGRETETAAGREIGLQLRLLRASLLRAANQLEGSNLVLDLIHREVISPSTRAPFQYYLQRAINLYALGEYSPALEHFLLADSVASGAHERSVCLMNVIATLDNLNLPWEATYTELSSVYEQAKDSIFGEPVRKQLEGFKLRRAFRTGDFEILFDRARCDDMDQSQYSRLWASRLPYVKRPLRDAEVILKKLVAADHFYARDYRLQTILADPRLSVNAAFAVPLREKIDRLYLWTWNWLFQPNQSHRQNLVACLQSFDFIDALTKMTFEDFQMMRNALSWIALFQEDMATSIHRYLELFTVKSCEPFPIFEYEYQLLRNLRSLKSGRLPVPASDVSLDVDLNDSEDLQLRALSNDWAHQFTEVRSQSHLPSPIKINAATNQIHLRNETLISQPLAHLLLAFTEKDSLSFGEALWRGFGIVPYDDEMHAPKINNCLSRLKTLLPRGSTLKTRDRMIYWQGSKPASEIITKISSMPLAIPLLEERFDLFPTSTRRTSKLTRAFEQPTHPRMIVEEAAGKKIFSREELQGHLGVSKATANRWIRQWRSKGLIRAEGSGRAIFYHIDII